MPAIADAVLLAGQQLIDELFIGVGRFVAEKRLLLLGRRRNADEIEIHAPHERRSIGRADWFQSLGPMLSGNERIDRVRRIGHPTGTWAERSVAAPRGVRLAAFREIAAEQPQTRWRDSTCGGGATTNALTSTARNSAGTDNCKDVN